MSDESKSTYNILGTKIAVTNMNKAVSLLTHHLDAYRGCYVTVANVHTTVMAYEDADYRHIQNQAVMAVPDGKPLSLLCRYKGYKDAERVAGPDLMDEIIRVGIDRGYTHYFYGSTEKTLTELEQKLREKYPGIQIAGAYSPPFRPLTEAENKADIVRINESQADFIWVGLGAPKQENWMYKNQNKTRGLMIGVGAAFDFHAGTLKRAPKWMQEWCLEWLYRLFQDPRRLYKRYLYTNFKFLWLILTGKN